MMKQVQKKSTGSQAKSVVRIWYYRFGSRFKVALGRANLAPDDTTRAIIVDATLIEIC